MICWGASKGSAQIVFPISYTSHYSVVGITVTLVAATGNTGIVSVYKNSLSSCYIYDRNAGGAYPYVTDPISWIALGY